MQLSNELALALHRAGDRPIVDSSMGTHRGTDIWFRAEQLQNSLADNPVSCLLCPSNQPADILAYVCLAAEGIASVLLLPDYLLNEAATFAELSGAGAIVSGDGSLAATRPKQQASGPRDEVLLVTSGTTGTPKIVRHRISSLCGRIRAGAPELRVWLLTYLPTSFAGIQVLLTAALAGDLVVQAPRTYDKVLAVAKDRSVTHLSCTPTFLRALIAAGASDAIVPSIRQITLGGEIADQRTLDSARQRFPRAQISHIYAATETGALFSVRDGREGFPQRWLQDGIEGVHFRILNDTLQIRSPRSMIGYVGADGSDDWIDTGDLVRINGDRVLFAGRRDRRINVGGAKVIPEDVERAIMEIPGVVDAVVTGVPNPLTGESVVAEVVTAEESDTDLLRQQIFSHLRTRLANHQVPRILRFVNQVTLSPAGKKAASSI